jgi:ferredoxin-like protein FixX
MAGMFINVLVDASVARDPDLSAKLVEVCPVSIFETSDDGNLRIAEENLDECVLCDLCTAAAPNGGVHVIRLYEIGQE